MKTSANQLDSLFFQGRYQDVLKSFTPQIKRSDIPVMMGSLAFTGRMQEAETLYQLRAPELKRDELIATRFYLALGRVRESSYQTARLLLLQNLLELRNKTAPLSQFYIYQGAAFYRYFSGRWEHGLELATKAFAAAFEADFTYGKMLATDLRGHLLLQLTNVDEGLKFLTDALKIARRLKNTAVINATDISILTYEAQYGLKIANTVEELELKLSTLKESDTYTKATLLLELARQLMLRGKAPEVKHYLDQASSLIYRFKNRRQEAQLNLRWANLSLLNGEPWRALSFTQSAERALDKQVDHSLELEALGMQFKIVTKLKMQDRAVELQRQITALSQQFGGMIHRRILARSQNESYGSRGDRLGEIIDQKDAAVLLKNGLLGLLYDLQNFDYHERVLVLDLLPGLGVVFDQGRVQTVSGLTPLLRKVLEALALNRGKKEELMRYVWGYDYDPLRHDAQIYNTLTSLRKILGPTQHWVETTEQGYRLLAEVQMKLSEEPKRAQTREVHLRSSLNYRQLSFLKKVRPGEFIHVKSYQKQFQVAEITACRDLAMLHREGYLLRVGKARATRYQLPGDAR